MLTTFLSQKLFYVVYHNRSIANCFRSQYMEAQLCKLSVRRTKIGTESQFQYKDVDGFTAYVREPYCCRTRVSVGMLKYLAKTN
jgi:hypothetical protein